MLLINIASFFKKKFFPESSSKAVLVSYIVPIFIEDQVDPALPASLTWQRKIDSDAKPPREFNLTAKEIFQLVPMETKHFKYNCWNV